MGYYEAIVIAFKCFLWVALALLQEFRETQLTVVLIINVIQVCVFLKLAPYGGADALVLNLFQSLALFISCCINLGGIFLGYLDTAIALNRAVSISTGDQ